jgi:hypothetical protein
MKARFNYYHVSYDDSTRKYNVITSVHDDINLGGQILNSFPTRNEAFEFVTERGVYRDTKTKVIDHTKGGSTYADGGQVMYLKKDYGYRGHKGDPIVVHKVDSEYEIVYGSPKDKSEIKDFQKDDLFEYQIDDLSNVPLKSEGGGIKDFRVVSFDMSGRRDNDFYFDTNEEAYEKFIDIRSDGSEVIIEKRVGDEYETIESYDPMEYEENLYLK